MTCRITNGGLQIIRVTQQQNANVCSSCTEAGQSTEPPHQAEGQFLLSCVKLNIRSALAGAPALGTLWIVATMGWFIASRFDVNPNAGYGLLRRKLLDGPKHSQLTQPRLLDPK